MMMMMTGFFLTVQSTVVSDIVGVDNISRAQAFVLVATGIGALVGVPLAGKRLSTLCQKYQHLF